MPEPGATLNVRDCNPTGIQRLCTDQLRVVFGVRADRDVADASLTVQFLRGAARCGFAQSSSIALTAPASRKAGDRRRAAVAG